MNNEEKIEKKFDEKKKSKKGLVLFLLLLIIIAAVAFGYYYNENSKPKNILKKYVNQIKVLETEKIETEKSDYIFTVKLDSKDKSAKDVFDEISKCSLKLGTQLDIKNKVELVDVGLDYDNQNAIDARLVYKNNEIYAYLNEIFEKYIKIDMDENIKDELNKSFDTIVNQDTNGLANEFVTITKDFLNEKIDSLDNIEEEKTSLVVNGKEKNVKKITITKTVQEFATAMGEYAEKISECKLYSSNEDIKNAIKKMAKELKNAELDGEGSIKLIIYTEGLNNDFVCFENEIFIKESNMNIKLQILKQDKDSYKYAVTMDGQGLKVDIISGEVKIVKEIENKKQEKGKMTITMEIPEMITQGEKINAEINMEYNAQLNCEIENINVENSINMNEMTNEDIQNILNKLEARPLIGELINTFSSMNMIEDIEL